MKRTVQATRDKQEQSETLKNKEKSWTIKVLFRSFFTTINFNKGSLEKVFVLYIDTVRSSTPRKTYLQTESAIKAAGKRH